MAEQLRWTPKPPFHGLPNSHTGITLCGIATEYYGNAAPAPSDIPLPRWQICGRCRGSRAYTALTDALRRESLARLQRHARGTDALDHGGGAPSDNRLRDDRLTAEEDLGPLP